MVRTSVEKVFKMPNRFSIYFATLCHIKFSFVCILRGLSTPSPQPNMVISQSKKCTVVPHDNRHLISILYLVFWPSL